MKHGQFGDGNGRLAARDSTARRPQLAEVLVARLQCVAEGTGKSQLSLQRFSTCLPELQSHSYAGTASFVAAAYPELQLQHAAQVCQLFDLGAEGEGAKLMQPATGAEILAALLGVLRDAHWCLAMRCPPEPGLMTPISLATACRGDLGTLDLSFDLQRAIAAAERRAYLLPESGCELLHLAHWWLLPI